MERESGRPCGCDQAADHVCARHSTPTPLAVVKNRRGDALLMEGPTETGAIQFILTVDGGGMEAFALTRWEAEQLVALLEERLKG